MKKKTINLEKDHKRLFKDINQDHTQGKQEWVKQGDSFKQFTIYTDRRTPILSPNTNLTENLR